MNIEHRTSNTERRTGGSWRLRSLWGLLAIGVVLSTGAQTNTNTTSAANTNSATAGSSVPALYSFKVIGDNNIFDPFRRPRVIRDTTPTRRADAFALTGTMSYTKGKFAFFNGTSQQYYKVLGVGGNIAGYTVKDITQTNVTLSAKGKDFQMPVGQQLRNEGGNWKMLGQPIEELNSDTNSDDATANADASTPPQGANAQMSDILKRLMQAREQELK